MNLNYEKKNTYSDKKSIPINQLCTTAATLEQNNDHISTGLKTIDNALGGGLKLGDVAEFGIPPGKNGRRLLLHFLIHKKPKTLWIYENSDYSVYPPSWYSLGVDLKKVFFISDRSYLKNLKAVFYEKFFDLIIIDHNKKPNRDEWLFFSLQARRTKKLIIVIQSHFIGTNFGNPFAKVRANIWFDYNQKHYKIHPIKGIFGSTIHIPIIPEHSKNDHHYE